MINQGATTMDQRYDLYRTNHFQGFWLAAQNVHWVAVKQLFKGYTNCETAAEFEHEVRKEGAAATDDWVVVLAGRNVIEVLNELDMEQNGTAENYLLDGPEDNRMSAAQPKKTTVLKSEGELATHFIWKEVGDDWQQATTVPLRHSFAEATIAMLEKEHPNALFVVSVSKPRSAKF